MLATALVGLLDLWNPFCQFFNGLLRAELVMRTPWPLGEVAA